MKYFTALLYSKQSQFSMLNFIKTVSLLFTYSGCQKLHSKFNTEIHLPKEEKKRMFKILHKMQSIHFIKNTNILN